MIKRLKSNLKLLRTDFSAQVLLGLLIFLAVLPLIYGFPSKFIAYDTFGYYLYLPQFFIEGDIALSDPSAAQYAIDHYELSHVFYQAHDAENGNLVIQYSSGMALVFLPFFLIGHCFAWMLDYPMDGYSAPYHLALLIGGYFYTIVGLILLRKILRHFFNPLVSGLTLVVLLLGTNYLNIQTQSIGMPHIYLFAFYSALIYFTIKWHQEQKLKYAIFIGIVLGWMVLIRPTEIFAVFIPIFWGIYDKVSFKEKFQLLWKNYRMLILCALAAGLMISIQLVYWKHTTGFWVYNSYRNPGEGLNLDHPHLLKFLFSYRKGWLLYTPLMFLPFIALFLKTGSRNKWMWPLILFSIFTIYVSSCWSAWWYAASFSQRTMMQSYPLFALGIGALIQYFLNKGKIKLVVFPVIGLFVVLSVFQTWQFMVHILPPDRITKEYYWEVFGQTKLPDGAYDLLSIDRETAVFDPEKYEEYWSDEIVKEQHLEGVNEWGEGFKIPFEETCNQDYCWYQVDFDAYVPEGSDAHQILVVCHFTYVDQAYAYTPMNLDQDQETVYNEWVHYTFHWISAPVRLPEDRFFAFIWSRQEEIIFKNFKVTSFVEKDR